MNHKIFISYSSINNEIAKTVCLELEQNNIKCWMAPRDIDPGREYGEALEAAISHSTTLLLVFSEAANNSPQVKREVERAASKNINILVYRIEDVRPTGSLSYFISFLHWLDAYLLSPSEQKIKLIEAAKRSIQITKIKPSSIESDFLPELSIPDVQLLKVMCWEQHHWRIYNLDHIEFTKSDKYIEIKNTSTGHYHIKLIYNHVLSGNFQTNIDLRGAYIDIQLQISSGQDKNYYINPSSLGIDIQDRQRFCIQRIDEAIFFNLNGSSQLSHEAFGGLPLMSCYSSVAIGFGATVFIHGWNIK